MDTVMNKEEAKDKLITTFLIQSSHMTEQGARESPNYSRLSLHLENSSVEDLCRWYNYITEKPLRTGDSLGKMIHDEAHHRNFDQWENRRKGMPKFKKKEPYSVDMLLNS